LSRVDACIQGILRHPELRPIAYDKYRRALVRRFPYAVYYEDSKGEVIIYGAFHTSRDAAKWRSRLP
jgi:hypothetical protein